VAEKVLIPLYGEEVAPRFDLATEVWVARWSPGRGVEEEKTVVLARASAEALCQLILTENVDTVVCGGIEEEYFDYLKWKRVRVLDSVVGFYRQAFEALAEGSLRAGAVLFSRVRGED